MRIAAAGTHDSSRDLHAAVAQSLAVLDDYERATARSLNELGDIELPTGPAAGAADPALLEPVGPFYLAWQLELAGLLRTAELIAGLFASGSITAPLGAAGQQLAGFWRERHTRLAPQERMELFQRVFEPPYFDRLLGALMQGIAQLGDHPEIPDWREAAQLEQSGEQLIEFLASRAGGMVPFAARDITTTINSALRFMREPALLHAFAVHNLWELVQFAGGDTEVPFGAMQQHVDLGKSGQAVLIWLAGNARASTLHLDPSTPGFGELVGAAQRWLVANSSLSTAPPVSVTPTVPMVPMAPVAPAPIHLQA